jgi:signal transduction histidine kinase
MAIKTIKKAMRNLSIKNKIILIIESVFIFVLIVAFTVGLSFYKKQLKNDLIARTITHAKLIGEYSIIPLSFQDQDGGNKTLFKLNSIQSIKNARVYDDKGRLFANYNRENEAFKIPGLIDSSFHFFQGNYLHVYEDITFEGQDFGTIYIRASNEEIAKTMQKFAPYIALLIIGLIIISYFLAYQLQKFISIPILRLADTTKKISDDENFSIRVIKHADDEIGTLYDSFNLMLDRIEYYIKELEKNNQELEEFNYVASHDLREPLRTLTSYCNLLEEDVRGDLSQDAQDDIDYIKSAATRMNKLIQDLLLLSRTGRTEFNIKTVDLNLCVKNVVADLKTSINENKGKVEYGELPKVRADQTQITQVFENLISNALKFHGRDNPVIKIGVKEIESENYEEKTEQKLEISVSDNGIGMQEKHLQQIFAPFKRLHGINQYEGTGIGLAICKKIIERLGGDIWVESQEGKGSTFKFTLYKI